MVAQHVPRWDRVVLKRCLPRLWSDMWEPSDGMDSEEEAARGETKLCVVQGGKMGGW